jgi:peptidoglycan/LPS O-acetylase OafA/YrhL
MAATDVRDHLVTLDALREIAIWAVVTHHMLSPWEGAVGTLKVPVLGWDVIDALYFMPGVPLFYLLSGYLLSWTEGKRAERGTYSLRSYATRRVLRLVPAYYVAIAVVLLIWPKPASFWDVVSHLFFVQGLTPTTRARCPRRSGL